MNGSDINLLDAYLDGLLSVDARRTFESEVSRSSSLRDQVNLQHVIDDALRRLFPVPALDDATGVMSASLAAAGPRAAVRTRGRRSVDLRKGLAIAAVIVLSAVGAYRLWNFFNPTVHDGRYFRTNPRTMDAIYHAKVAEGFMPDWKCDTDDRFKRAFEHQLFQPLVLLTPPPGVSMVGLGYCNTLSPHSMYMLAHVDNERVIVFVDRVEADRNLPPLKDASLNRFRREVGELVLYEVTPLSEPHFLELFTIPRP